ncbi:MAG: pyridoxal phosphate-dependent decarboxylase family protein [Gemmatimonadaceae bacterium]
MNPNVGWWILSPAATEIELQTVLAIVRLGIDDHERIDPAELRVAIERDREAGITPFLVIATAGTTNTGAIDPIGAIADVCSEAGVWLHVDGAYGAPVAALPGASRDLKAISRADSLAIDPHKWLYAPLEAGCALVRKREDLLRAYSHHPHYYHFAEAEGESGTNFHELGLQNSRGFRALKVWLAMRQVGRAGYVEMMEQDISLAREMFKAVDAEETLEVRTCELSIVTFRYVPPDLRSTADESTEYLNRLNEDIVSALQLGGEIFVSNATIRGVFLLRACVVNFRTTTADVCAVPGIVVEVGKRIDAELRGR